MNQHYTLTYLSTVNWCCTHPSAPSYSSHNLLWWCDGGLAWTSTMHIDQHHANSSIHIDQCTFIDHNLALHTSICTFLNTCNGPTWMGSLHCQWIYYGILSLRWYRYIINFYWTVWHRESAQVPLNVTVFTKYMILKYHVIALRTCRLCTSVHCVSVLYI